MAYLARQGGLFVRYPFLFYPSRLILEIRLHVKRATGDYASNFGKQVKRTEFREGRNFLQSLSRLSTESRQRFGEILSRNVARYSSRCQRRDDAVESIVTNNIENY